jgi:hypothetical protein
MRPKLMRGGPAQFKLTETYSQPEFFRGCLDRSRVSAKVGWLRDRSCSGLYSMTGRVEAVSQLREQAGKLTPAKHAAASGSSGAREQGTSAAV